MRLALLVLAFVVGGCQLLGPTAAEVCDAEASTWSGVVVRAFDTTVGAIRRVHPGRVDPPLWPDRPDGHPAILCYIDGSIPKAPPGLEPFDRGVVAVVDGQGQLINAGYRDQLPVRAP